MVIVWPNDLYLRILLFRYPCKIVRVDAAANRVTVEFEGLRYNLGVEEIARTA